MQNKVTFAWKDRTVSTLFYAFLFIGLAWLLLVPRYFVSAATTVGNNVSVGGTLAVTGATTFTAATTHNGAVDLGDATDDTLTITARIDSDVNPSTNDARDLGAFGNAWAQLFASSTSYIVNSTFDQSGAITFGTSTSNTIIPTARLAGDLDPSSNNARDLGAFSLAYNDIFTSGTAFLGSVTSTQITPWANNTSDLGAFGNAWNDIFTSGTAYLDNVTSTYISATNLTLGGTLEVTSATTFTGATTHNGSVDLGDTTDDTLTVTARIDSDVNPSTNNARDLGVFSFAWNDIFASGTAYLGSVTSTQITPWANNTSDLGAFDNAWKDLYVSGTLYVGTLTQWDTSVTISNNLTVGDATSTDIFYLNARVAGHIEPTVNNVSDLGIFGQAWSNVFVSSTVYAGGLLPGTAGNDNDDLGAFGLAWNDIFVSGTAYLDNVTSTSISATNLTLGGTLEVAGATTFNGALAIGDDIGIDTITLFARFSSNLEAEVNNDVDLGAFNNAWNDIFTSGTLYANNIIGNGDKVGVATSTPFAQFSVGAGGVVTSTISVGKFCMYAGDEAGEAFYIYIPFDGANGNVFATTTDSCF